MRISDWSSDVCSSDLGRALADTMAQIVGDGARARGIRHQAYLKIRQAGEQATALRAASQSIEQMLALIVDMARRTNMLALNAGIEAAQDRKSTRLNSSH